MVLKQVGLVLLFGLLFFSCSKFTRIQKRGTLDEKYAAAMDYFERKNYYKASILLEELIPLYRGRKEAELAQYYYAQCHYYSNDFILSAHYFKEFYTTYPRSEYTEDCRYLFAKSLLMDSPDFYLDQSNTYKAISAFQQYINLYPQSEKVKEANDYIDKLRAKLMYKDYINARLYSKTYHYKAAIKAYASYVEKWPDSPHNEEAYYYRVVAAYLYAKNSTSSKKKERYEQVLEIYTNFVDKFQNSSFRKDAEDLYELSRKALENLKKKESYG